MLKFNKAVPIWVSGAENEMHYRAQFKARFNYQNDAAVNVALATSGIYNLYVNGVFLAYGPARAGKGHFRIDNLDITDFLLKGENTVVIEVCGYNSTGFYLQKQPSFLIAEITVGDTVVCFTGKDFTARKNPYYIQKSQRYSYQRPMVEAYNITKVDTFLTDDILGDESVSEVLGGIYLPRITEKPLYERLHPRKIEDGAVEIIENADITYDRSVTQVGEELSGFALSELDAFVTKECQQFKFSKNEKGENNYTVYEFPFCASGMLSFTANCEEDATVYFLFDEVLTDGDVDFLRGDCANTIKYTLSKGIHHLKVFEVYTMKYVKVVIFGKCEISNLNMLEYKRPPVNYDTSVFEGELQSIADAAIETFRQNSVDLFYDCPSRERAGWLCDSYFSGQVEALLCGNNNTEKCYLENFLCEENYNGIPDGMVPMCYPADAMFGDFIPQWSLWLLLELENYYKRTNDRDLIERFEGKVFKLLKYFSGFENEFGLLEKLDGWQFVEWSKANELVNDLNYPTNMLYSRALKAVANMYNKPELYIKGEKIAKTVLEKSFNGEFFCDNAVRQNGVLVNTNECTEVCQYYAFFFGIANKESHNALLKTLIEDFGPKRAENNKYPQIYPANAFIGNYLRLDILMQYGEYDKALENIKGYFYYMAERTGTLWEHTGTTASCDHGFASYVICWLDKLKKLGKI